jgi:phytanoyl-CoA hydroxylase
MMPHRTETTFMEALRNPKIVNIMERLLAGRVSAIQSQFFFCKPGTIGFASHQDNYYVEASGDAFASAWSPLQDVKRDMGCLIVYPGTHREPILPVREVSVPHDPGQDPNAHTQEVVIPEGYQPVDMIVPGGSTLFLHAHTVHASHKNVSDRWRRVLLTTYIRSGAAFRPGRSAGRAEVDLYS